jgi:hypothetical protein
MRGKNKTAFLTASLFTVIILALVLPGVLAAPRRVVYLQATFRDANNDVGQPVDKMRSDGQGPYVNARYITVQISDAGELRFTIDSKSGRRSVFIYDDRIFSYIPYGNCQELPPDTACNPYDGLPDEPITYAEYNTYNGSSFLGPQVNLLTMQPGDAADLRIWIAFQTSLRAGSFYSKYNKDFLETNQTGIVRVSAVDTNGDGTVDRWILSPLPGTDNKVNLHRVWQVKSKYAKCDIGCFRLPFELVLDRLQ